MRATFLPFFVALGAAGAAALVVLASRRASFFAGAVILVVGLVLLALSLWQLGRAFSLTFTPQAKGLVTHGLYSRIPHPMYVFMGVAFLGAIIMLGRPWLVLLWIAFIIEAAWHARREAKVLEDAFGDAYRNYRRRTWW